MYFGNYEPPGFAGNPRPSTPQAPLAPEPTQLNLPLEEHPRTGYTLSELVDSTRRAGKEASSSFHGASKLNKSPTYTTEAQNDLYQAGKKLVNTEFDKAIEHGYADPSDVAGRAAANKKFSTLATIAPNVAKKANQFKRAEMKPASKSDSFFGTSKGMLSDAKDRLLGVNSQYAIGRGVEGAGEVSGAAAELTRAASGLGWFNQNHHPEIARAQQENPDAPKAAVEQKANDDMKAQLQKTWYNVLSAVTQ